MEQTRRQPVRWSWWSSPVASLPAMVLQVRLLRETLVNSFQIYIGRGKRVFLSEGHLWVGIQTVCSQFGLWAEIGAETDKAL